MVGLRRLRPALPVVNGAPRMPSFALEMALLTNLQHSRAQTTPHGRRLAQQI